MGKKQKVSLLEEETTYKCDYQIWPLDRTQAKFDDRRREEPAPKPPPPYIPIDPQSHASYRPSAHVPFDLYVECKPIVQTDPRECFSLVTKPEYGSSIYSHGLNTILPPALPVSEIHNEDDLRRLLKYTYTGAHKVCMEEAAMKPSIKPNPPNRVIEEGSDLRYKAELYPPLPRGWIAAANHWDCLQSRSLGDPFKSFWTRRGPEVECSCCCNPLPTMLSKETKDEIRKLILEENLRLPYDVTKTGFAGYRQICAKGVPLAKRKT